MLDTTLKKTSKKLSDKFIPSNRKYIVLNFSIKLAIDKDNSIQANYRHLLISETDTISILNLTLIYIKVMVGI